EPPFLQRRARHLHDRRHPHRRPGHQRHYLLRHRSRQQHHRAGVLACERPERPGDHPQPHAPHPHPDTPPPRPPPPPPPLRPFPPPPLAYPAALHTPLPTHRFLHAEAVPYPLAGGGPPIQNLTPGQVYFVIVVNDDTIQLADSEAHAQAGTALAVNATGASGT